MVWRTVTIGDYLLKTELRDPTRRPGDPFFYVDVSSVDNQAYAIRQPTELLGAEAPSRARKVIRERDVLFATVRPTLRRIALVDSALDNQICSTGFCVLRASETLDAAFLYYWLITDDVMAHVAKIEKGVSYPAVRDSDIKAIRIPYPPLDEQRQIAAVLSAVQHATEQQARMIALTAELKKALMHKLFTAGPRGEKQKHTGIGLVPRSWIVDRLDSFCVLQRGFDITKGEQTDGPVPVVSSGGVKSYHNVAKVAGPGVVVGRKGTLGTVHYVEAAYWPHDTTLWVKDFRGNDPRFTAYFLDRLDFARFDSGASNPTLNRNTVHAETVAYPPVEQQREIAVALSTIERKNAVHQRYAASLSSLFRTLLHQLMTAQVRVHELDLSALDEAAQGPAGAV